MGTSPTRTDEVLADLRGPSDEPQLLRGFGPLVVAAVLGVLMMLLLPSVAPERIVERPADDAPATDPSGPHR